VRNPLEMLFATLFSSFFCLAIAADDANNLVAHYTFNEGSGDVLHDRSGNGHDRKIVGSQWALQEWGPLMAAEAKWPCKRSHAWIREQWCSRIQAQAESGLSARNTVTGMDCGRGRSSRCSLAYVLPRNDAWVRTSRQVVFVALSQRFHSVPSQELVLD